MSGYIYLVENPERTAMKIGFSANPEMRAMVLGCTLLHTLRGEREGEKKLHNKFRALWLSGEWFKHSPQIVSYFIQAGGRTIKAKKARQVRTRMSTVCTPIPSDLANAMRRIAKKEGKFMYAIVEGAFLMWLTSSEKGAA